MIALLQGEPEGLQIGSVGIQLLGYIGTFAMYGAVGAHGVSARTGRPDAASGTQPTVASIGAVGGVLSLASLLIAAASRAVERHVGLGAALAAGGSRLALEAALLALATIGFLLGRVRVTAGWWLAGGAVVALALRALATGQWAGLVNPLHILAGGLWIGTLGVLVVALFPALLRARDDAAPAAGSRLDAVVRRFSTLALASSALLAVTGVTTAWRHLGRLSALWTTPYGWTLDVKLLLVAGIVSLGFYNWRFATPALGAGEGDANLARTSRREVLLGLAVLVVTSVLVSLPAPAEKEHHDGPPPRAADTPAVPAPPRPPG